MLSFSVGKPSALVVDVGASSISITPVHDGLILKKGVVRSPLAGNYVSDQLRLLFSTASPPIPLNPYYLISSKSPVEANAPPQATFRNFANGAAPAPSYRRLQEERLLTEFKETVVQIWPTGRLAGHDAQGRNNLESAKNFQPRHFEMPDGYNQAFGVERYRAAEGLFDLKLSFTDPSNAPQPGGQTLPELIKSSLSQVDVDIRPHLLANVVVVGGTTLIHGFTERLDNELKAMFPGPRVKLAAPGNVYERKFASWLGGSILASLGTFHQVCRICFLLSLPTFLR